MGPDVVWSHLSMDGCVIVIVPDTNFVYILVSLVLNFIGRCSIFNPKSGVSLQQN
jgi:hypothetical protein